RPSLAARSARPSPTRRFRSSDSTTQGPAMRNGTEPKCGVIALFVPAGELGPAPNLRPGAHVAVLASRADEAGEQRVRPRGAQLAGVGAEPHCAAHFLDAFLRAHQGDHRVLAFGLELARVGVRELADVARELNDGRLQAEADAEERQLVLARPANRLEHSLHA